MKYFLNRILPIVPIVVLALISLSVLLPSSTVSAAVNTEPDVNAAAADACSDYKGDEKDACKKGYVGAYGGDDQDKTCDKLKGKEADACKKGFDKGHLSAGDDIDSGSGGNEECKGLKGDEKQACKKGFDAGYDNDDKDKTCGKFKGKAKKACEDAYDKGRSAASTTTKKCNPLKETCPDPAAKASCDDDACDLVQLYLNPAIALLSGLVGLVVAGSIIFGGIEYSSSQGDPQKAAKAKSRITNAIFALIAYLFLWAFLQFLIPGGVFNR